MPAMSPRATPLIDQNRAAELRELLARCESGEPEGARVVLDCLAEHGLLEWHAGWPPLASLSRREAREELVDAVLRAPIWSERARHELALALAELLLPAWRRHSGEDPRPAAALARKREWLDEQISGEALALARTASWSAWQQARERGGLSGPRIAAAGAAAAWACETDPSCALDRVRRVVSGAGLPNAAQLPVVLHHALAALA